MLGFLIGVFWAALCYFCDFIVVVLTSTLCYALWDVPVIGSLLYTLVFCASCFDTTFVMKLISEGFGLFVVLKIVDNSFPKNFRRTKIACITFSVFMSLLGVSCIINALKGYANIMNCIVYFLVAIAMIIHVVRIERQS